MNILIIGIFAIIAAVVVSRALTARGQNLLSYDQQNLLLEALAPVRNISLIVFIISIVALVIVYNFFGNRSTVFSGIIIALFLVYLFIFSGINYIKIKKLELPGEYIKLNLISMLVRIAGLVVFIACYIYYYYTHGYVNFNLF